MAAVPPVYVCLLIRVQQGLGSEPDCEDSVTQHFGDAGLCCLSCRMKSRSFQTRLALSFCYVWAFPFCLSSPRGLYRQIGLHSSNKCFANELKRIEQTEKCRWCVSGLAPGIWRIGARVRLVHSQEVWGQNSSFSDCQAAQLHIPPLVKVFKKSSKRL